VQNEPENSNPTYPTCLMSVDDMGQIGTKLRTLLNVAGLGATKIIGFEHNWVNASSYPVQLVRNNTTDPTSLGR
jgi:4-alpha-glucanotransferase